MEFIDHPFAINKERETKSSEIELERWDDSDPYVVAISRAKRRLISIMCHGTLDEETEDDEI